MLYKKALLILFTCLLTAFILIEFFLRIQYREQLKSRHYPLIYIPSDTFGYTFKKDTIERVNLVEAEKKVEVNENGFISPAFNKVKDPKVFRIFIVGTSNVIGYWVPDKLIFTRQLEALFKRAGYNVEVINAGKDGTTLDLANINMVKYELVKYKPDLVLLQNSFPISEQNSVRESYKGYVIGYQSNSKTSQNKCRKIVDKIEDEFLYKVLYDYSYIFRAIQKKMYESLASGGYDNDWSTKRFNWYQKKRIDFNDWLSYTYSIKGSLNVYKELATFLEEKNILFSVYSEENNGSIKSLFTEGQIPFMNLNIYNDGKKDFKHKLDAHLNADGHTAISQKMFNELLSNKHISNLLNKKYKF